MESDAEISDILKYVPTPRSPPLLAGTAHARAGARSVPLPATRESPPTVSAVPDRFLLHAVLYSLLIRLRRQSTYNYFQVQSNPTGTPGVARYGEDGDGLR